MKRFISIFGVSPIGRIYADREFIGSEWVHYLNNAGIPFVIRIKNNMLIDGEHASTYFRDLPLNKAAEFIHKKKIYGLKLYVWGMRTTSGDYLIVITNVECQAIEEYALRWEIETLFGCLKSRGFEFEATHMTCEKKLSKLMCILALCYAWAHKSGEYQSSLKPIRIKTHGRKETSIFKVGLDSVRLALIHAHKEIERFKAEISLLMHGFMQFQEIWE